MRFLTFFLLLFGLTAYQARERGQRSDCANQNAEPIKLLKRNQAPEHINLSIHKGWGNVGRRRKGDKMSKRAGSLLSLTSFEVSHSLQASLTRWKTLYLIHMLIYKIYLQSSIIYKIVHFFKIRAILTESSWRRVTWIRRRLPGLWHSGVPGTFPQWPQLWNG